MDKLALICLELYEEEQNGAEHTADVTRYLKILSGRTK